MANEKSIAGVINSVTVESSSKVSFSGTFTGTEEGSETYTFNAVAEDPGTGTGVDKLSVTDSSGYSKFESVSNGGIVIVQQIKEKGG